MLEKKEIDEKEKDAFRPTVAFEIFTNVPLNELRGPDGTKRSYNNA